MNKGMKSLALALIALLVPIAVHASQWGFAINNPTTAVNPGTGQRIRTHGAGLFDDLSGAVSGGGSYSITNASGKVIERGTWAATSYVSFASDGGINKGIQGGTLKILITLMPTQGTARNGQLMTIICPFEASEGLDEEDDSATVGNFSVPAGGITVFHLIQP
jgi:hypothetical protein